MAGLIEGPCEVLPPSKFKDENERRSQLDVDSNSGLHPIFICKYVYILNSKRQTNYSLFSAFLTPRLLFF